MFSSATKMMFTSSAAAPPAAGPVAFNAIGGGKPAATSGTASPYNFSWSHTAAGSGRAVIVAIGGARVAAGGIGSITRSATYGGVAMTELGARMTNNEASGSFYSIFWGLLAPATGAQIVAISLSASGINLGAAGNSASYTGVGSFGSVSSAFGMSGSSMSHTVTGSESGNMIAQSFVAENSSGVSITAYNRTSRFSVARQSWSPAVLGGDAAGAASVAFTGTKSGSARWASWAVDLISA